MLRFSFTALVLTGALFGIAADSPQAGAGSTAQPALASPAHSQPGKTGGATGLGDHAASLPTDCPCAGECGMAENVRHRDE